MRACRKDRSERIEDLVEYRRTRQALGELIRVFESELSGQLEGALQQPGELRAIPGPKQRSGTKPISFVEDERGDRFVLKTTSGPLFAAEELAHSVRKLGGRPAVPVEALEAGKVLKPYVDSVGSLAPNPADWSALQREVIVREHPWEWLLLNLDTHRDQYVLVGEHRYPLNIDWDRSFDVSDAELTRFTAHRAFTPPARNLLYDAYVRGRVKLHFKGMFEEISKIEAIPEDRFRALLERFARKRFDDPVEAEAFVSLSVERKSGLRAEFQELVCQLVAERAARAGRPLTKRARTPNLLANTGKGALLRSTGVVHRSAIGDALRGLTRRLNAHRLGA